ncbi:glycoside hydrolase family 47 protein [Pluteus cervinus]|uniref:Glycoside hydrolase family 47 protein n=1 Tax=Pluteus cervinus TaxID=181527 RepID=A0ACD3BD86_9AGAR|nr:glycoside hydrolase family 47 protein [Pluteus cervinus]
MHLAFAPRSILYALVLVVATYLLYVTFVIDHSLESLPHSAPPSQQEIFPEVSSEEWACRADQVKQGFKHAYHSYEKYAAPYDELLPITHGKINNFNGWGVTAFDSLDTMLIMDLQHEFERALGIVARANFSVSSDRAFVPYFETVIRYLGGLLGAYALSHEKLLLDRADELAMILDGVFDSASGLPFYGVNPASGKPEGSELGILAEMATLQLEYTYLAKLTGKKDYFNHANNVMRTLYSADLHETGGMLPVIWNLTSGTPVDTHLSVGSQADSTHEYLLKQYLLTGQTDKASLEMYVQATTFIITHLLFISPKRHLLYVTDTIGSTYKEAGTSMHTFEHLSCFLPGLLALGAHLLPLDNLASLGVDILNLRGRDGAYGHASKGYRQLASWNLKKVHLWAAEGLAQTCYLTYADQASGLGADEMVFGKWSGSKAQAKDHSYDESYSWIRAMETWRQSGSRGPPPGVGDKAPIVHTEAEAMSGWTKRDYVMKKWSYLLRPETVESLFILWRVTGDVKWRHRGWKIFEAIERETKTPSGYGSPRSVGRSPAPLDDNMPSYFLAETLKYLYLLFNDEELIPLDRWVFNTEAHPFPVFEWTEHEKTMFNL